MSNITNLNRDYLIKINVKEATIDVPKMTFWNTDKKTSNMFVQLVINMSTNELISNYVTVQNATDYKITLNVIKPKTNQYKTIEATLLNEEKALFEIDLPDEYKDQVGNYNFEFEVSSKVDGNDESITTSNGTYEVKGSILTNLNEETSSSPDLPILKQLIEQVKSLQGGDLTDYQKKNDSAQKTILEDGKLYLAKADGTKIDGGTTLPTGGGGSPIEVIDNLESDSTTAALSAKQGKVLNTQYKDIANEIIDIDDIKKSIDSLELPLTTSRVISKNLIDTTMFENLSVDDFFQNYASGDLVINVLEGAFEIGQAYNTEVMFTDGTTDASGNFFFQFQKNGTTIFSRYTFDLTDTIDSAKLIFNKTNFLANHSGKTFAYIQVCKKASGENYPTYEQYTEKKDYTAFVRTSDLEQLQLQKLSPFFYPKKVRMIGHRGGVSTYTENSIGAFTEGCKAGYDFIETDIWQTSDGELVCMHDQTLDRTTNGTGDVMTMTLEEIQAIKLNDGSVIPTFREFLLICKKYGKVPIVEIKNINQDWDKLAEELISVGMDDNTIILCSSISYLQTIRNILPKIHCSYLMYESGSVTEYMLNQLENLTNSSLNTNYDLTQNDIELCHQYKVIVGKWTIDDVDTANNLINLGIDFITTNNIDLIN